MGHHHVGGAGEFTRGQRFALGGDDLGALLALGLGLARHRALHRLGQLDVLQLDERHLDAPTLGLHVENLADVDVDAVGLRQRLVERVPTDDSAERRLGDLANRRIDIFDGDDRLDGINDAVVGDG